jgi:Ca-activated chloride channel family protein
MRVEHRRRNRSIPQMLAAVSCASITAALLCCVPTLHAQQKDNTDSQTKTPPAASAPATGRDEQIEFVNADLVKLTVTVTDSFDRYVTGIERDAFTILDNKVEQEIVFFNDEDAPASVGVLFDFSGSMSGEKVGRAREALKRFIKTSHEQDEYFLVGFNARANLLLDRTRDSDALLSKLTFVETKGNTALYDATYLGVEKVTRGTHDKRVLLIISDGQDNSSRYTFNEVRRLLKESGVLIYSVGIVDGGGSSFDAQGQAVLEELSGVSGGKAFFPATNSEMNEIFERISLELRHQYAIGYRPKPFTTDGKWRKVKVKVQPPRGLPRLFVRNKEGYFALATPR